MMNEKTIWNNPQNHPELIVIDCKKELGLTNAQADKVRQILLERGVNKWLYCRYWFIDLKHEVKDMLRAEKDKNFKNKLRYINAKMQNIAKSPRWIEWGHHVHKKMKNNIREVVIRGKHC